MQFYALAAFLGSKQVKTVITSLEWVVHKQQTERSRTRDAIPALMAVIRQHCINVEHSAALLDNGGDALQLFPRKTSGLCRGWCGIVDCPFNTGPTQVIRTLKLVK